MSIAFQEFVEKQSKKKEVFVDAESCKSDWLKNIQSLYTKVEEYLKSYIDSDQITISREPVKMYEEQLGEYDTEKLVILLGNEKVSFVPKGRFIIGAKGRVDIEGSSGMVKLLYVEEDVNTIQWEIKLKGSQEPTLPKREQNEVWKIASFSPKLSLISFDEDSVQQALMEVVNGYE